MSLSSSWSSDASISEIFTFQFLFNSVLCSQISLPLCGPRCPTLTFWLNCAPASKFLLCLSLESRRDPSLLSVVWGTARNGRWDGRTVENRELKKVKERKVKTPFSKPLLFIQPNQFDGVLEDSLEKVLSLASFLGPHLRNSNPKQQSKSTCQGRHPIHLISLFQFPSSKLRKRKTLWSGQIWSHPETQTDTFWSLDLAFFLLFKKVRTDIAYTFLVLFFVQLQLISN